jgi:hypothetical protein
VNLNQDCAFVNSGTILLAIVFVCSPKSVAGHMLPRLPISLTPQISHKHPSKILHPVPLKLFGSITIILWQEPLKCLQTFSLRRLPMQRSIWKIFHSVLPSYNGLLLFLAEPSHPYFLPLVESTLVDLPHQCGTLLQGKFSFLQAD